MIAFLAQASPDLDFSALGPLALKLAQGGQWAALLVLAFVALVLVLRIVLVKGLAGWIPWEPAQRALAWLGTDRGGVVLSIMTGMATVLGGALVAGMAITPGLIIGALLTACMGSGAWSMAKKIAAPADKKEAAMGEENARLERLVADQKAQLARAEGDSGRTVREQLNRLSGGG